VLVKVIHELLGSLSWADMITISSTSSLNLVFNSILSCKLLGETFTRYDLLSMLLIGLGSAVCVTFSNMDSSVTSYNVIMQAMLTEL
jgi:hypothetical protein